MNETARKIVRRVLAQAGITLALVSLSACGFPGYHFRDGTTPWLPGGAPSRSMHPKQSPPQPTPESPGRSDARPVALRKLDVAVGRWIFHGRTLKTAFSKPGTWVWHADCRWSTPGRLFLECSFNNVWNGRSVRSLVVDTYNTHDHRYWHYEMFEAGAGGQHPFASALSIQGQAWIESGIGGKSRVGIRQRIVYRYQSSTHVKVAIELSRDGIHWIVVDRGEGTKVRP